MPHGPAVQKAIDFITGMIASPGMCPGDALPSREQLARRIPVSTQSIALAIGHLKRVGALYGVGGQHPRMAWPDGHTIDIHTERAHSRRTWEEVAESMRDEIAAGAFRENRTFPTRKELQTRYRVSPPTIRKALESLRTKRVVTRQGRGFAVPSLTQSSADAQITFLWYSDEPYLPSHETDRSFLSGLERECHRNGLRLDKLMLSAESGRVWFRRYGEPRRFDAQLPDSCMGVVYLVNWQESVNSTVFDWLAHLGKPVSVVDWLGTPLPSSICDKPTIQWFGTSSSRNPGRDVGRHLVELGHRKVAYFSPFGAHWQAMRLNGITEALRQSDKSGVVPFVIEPGMDPLSLRSLILRKFTPQYRRVLHSARTPAFLSGLVSTQRANFGFFENANYFNELEPAFSKAMADTGITAWVGCSDVVAMMALSFLQHRGKKVPADISVMGFDNSFESIDHDLTSYDFNFPAVAATALHFLLRPNAIRGNRRLLRPQIEGSIIQRGTTGMARPS